MVALKQRTLFEHVINEWLLKLSLCKLNLFKDIRFHKADAILILPWQKSNLLCP